MIVHVLHWFTPRARARSDYDRARLAYAEALKRGDTRAMHHAAADVRRAMTKRLEVRA